MKLFNKKANQIEENTKETIEETTKEAIEVVLCFPNQDCKIDIKDNEHFRNSLIGRKVSIGSAISLREKKIGEEFSDLSDIFGDFGMDFLDSNLLVWDTKPKDVVEITKNTKIKIIDKPITERDIEKKNLIEVKKEPNFKNLIELKSLKEIVKLSKNFIINRFINKAKTVYFTTEYYYLKE